jgi:phosphate/sulfate permease
MTLALGRFSKGRDVNKNAPSKCLLSRFAVNFILLCMAIKIPSSSTLIFIDSCVVFGLIGQIQLVARHRLTGVPANQISSPTFGTLNRQRRAC